MNSLKLTLIFSLGICLLPNLSNAAVPAADFAKYATPAQNLTCKELDFTSYHKVENVKKNMLKLNPNLTHPNFAGKYLLMKNEFLFETVWFVADCSNGKFIKEMLSTDHKNPQAEFNANSSLIGMTSGDPKSTTPLEYHVFQNEKWMRVEATSMPTPTPTPTIASANTSTPIPTAPADPSEPQFTQYTVAPITTCKELDFSSNSRAENARKNLSENTPDRSRPNFGGHYLLLKGDTIFQNYWLIADCNTGKFLSELITGGVAFQKDSRLLKMYSSGNFANYQVWNDEDHQWIKIHGSNTAYGKTAKTLVNALPNSDKSSTVRFENLKCMEDHCEIDIGGETAKKITGPQFETLKIFTRDWGTNLTIKSGKCKDNNGKLTCELEN